MTDISSALISAAEAGRLRVRSIVLLDWHDGPVEGIAEVPDPRSCWHFRMIGERISSEDLDDRIYLFAHVPDSTIEPIRSIVGSPGAKPLVWPFSEQADQAKIEELVDLAIKSADAASLLVQSTTFRDVKGVWRFAGGTFQPR